jgi:hypothetical protein
VAWLLGGGERGAGGGSGWCRVLCSVVVEKKKKKNIFFVSHFRMRFLMPMASVYSLGGMQVVRVARERVWGCFFNEFKVGG